MTSHLYAAPIASMLIFLAGCQMSPSAADPAPATQPAIPFVHHILLEVSDLDRSLAFYRDQMGLRLSSRKGDFATLEAANVGVYLWQSRQDWETPPKPDERKGLGIYPHLAVQDVDATVARLAKAGYRIVQKPEHHLWGTEAFVADPDGYIWALVNMHD
jgi:catechol 2,3-dioxygenase